MENKNEIGNPEIRSSPLPVKVEPEAKVGNQPRRKSKPSKPSRKIPWLQSGKKYIMSKELLDDVYDSKQSKTRDDRFFYRKDSIAIEIDQVFPGCVIYIDKRNNAKTFWTLRAYCAHEGCRKYCLTAPHSNPGTFTIEYDMRETFHSFPLARQIRKYERDQAIQEAKTYKRLTG